MEYQDMYFIHERVKEIDPGYELQFNQKLKRFEVHKLGDRAGLAMVVQGYPDARVIEHILKTRVCRLDELLKEIDF